MSIEDTDMPSLFQNADKESIKSQKIHNIILLLYNISLIISALVIILVREYTVFARIITTILFLLSLGLIVSLRIIMPTKIWYNGRAIAESIKTRTWRWMMRAEPYGDCNNVLVVEQSFINDLKTIIDQNQSLIKQIGNYVDADKSNSITNKMRDIRSLNIDERLEVYKKERIINQEKWYNNKSKINKRDANVIFWLIIISHAIIFLLMLLELSMCISNPPIELFLVLASTFVSWNQTKKHNELASSYSLATHEIILMKNETNHIETEEDLSEYVLNCENAFSREHTQWYARKNS